MKTILSVLDKIVDIAAYLAGCLLFIMILMISFETIQRYFFNHTLMGATELTEYGLLWFTLLGSAWVLRNDKHIRIDVVLVLLKGKHKIALEFAINLLCLVVIGIVVYYSGKEVYKEYVKQSYMYSVLELPKYLIMMVMPVGFFMLFYEFLKKTCNRLHAMFD